jgi:membrane-anchored protein YejM (alkaline phosphatase superfamily)
LHRFPYLALAALGCSAAHAGPSTPVILISVDTLRADHLSCYQAGRRPTPHIDALAKNGTLFSQVSTPFPLTLPAHVALFTSTYPFANGVSDNGVPLQSRAITLATVLKSAGYRTAAFVGSFILDRRFGLSRGFDVYDGPFDLHNKIASGANERKRPGTQVAEAAMHWLDGNSGAPFFLFLHLYDLHLPYDLQPDPAQRHGETGYTAELAYVDRVLGDFLAFLEERQLLAKTLIVFASTARAPTATSFIRAPCMCLSSFTGRQDRGAFRGTAWMNPPACWMSRQPSWRRSAFRVRARCGATV